MSKRVEVHVSDECVRIYDPNSGRMTATVFKPGVRVKLIHDAEAWEDDPSTIEELRERLEMQNDDFEEMILDYAELTGMTRDEVKAAILTDMDEDGPICDCPECNPKTEDTPREEVESENPVASDCSGAGE